MRSPRRRPRARFRRPVLAQELAERAFGTLHDVFCERVVFGTPFPVSTPSQHFDPVGLAQEVPNAHAFERAVLERLQPLVGFDAAFFATKGPPRRR